MGTWKKIITSGSNASLLNITSSGGINLSTTPNEGASGTDDVLVLDASTGEIKKRLQSQIGEQGSSINTFATMSAGGVSLLADSTQDTLVFTAGANIEITGSQDSDTITFNAVTKSISEVQSIFSASLTDGTHQNITINEYSPNVFSLTGSQALTVLDTTGQQGIDLTVNGGTALTASLAELGTNDNVQFQNLTVLSNISASGYISASGLFIQNDATIGGDLTLDGNFLFDGYNFETSDILNHSGSNLFGSGSGVEPSQLFHEFTGSISITGSGVTLVDGIFTGDGSGLYNLSSSVFTGLGLLSSSQQIAADISGAYSADGTTIALGTSAEGQFSAITTGGIGDGNGNLATGDQIYDYIYAATQSLVNFANTTFITEVVTTTANSGLTGGATSGIVSLSLDIDSLADGTPVFGDFIAFNDGTDSTTKKVTIGDLVGIATASSEGTVTSIALNDGLDGSNDPITTTGTIFVGAGNNIIVTSDGVGLNPTITSNLTQVVATTGSFGNLTVTGDTTIIESEHLAIADNFMTLNSNLAGGGSPTEDAGLTVNRGGSPNANIYWEEGAGIDRWGVSLQDGVTVGAAADSYIATVSSSTAAPSAAPYGGTSTGYGNMHVDTDDGEIWIYV